MIIFIITQVPKKFTFKKTKQMGKASSSAIVSSATADSPVKTAKSPVMIDASTPPRKTDAESFKTPSPKSTIVKTPLSLRSRLFGKPAEPGDPSADTSVMSVVDDYDPPTFIESDVSLVEETGEIKQPKSPRKVKRKLVKVCSSRYLGFKFSPFLYYISNRNILVCSFESVSEPCFRQKSQRGHTFHHPRLLPCPTTARCKLQNYR